jgi:surface protein
MPFVGIGVGVGRQRFRGGGVGVLPFEFTIDTNNTSAGSSNSDQFKLPLISSLPLNAVVDWGDGNTDTITTFNQAETLHTYASAGSYTISITGDLSGWSFNTTGDRLKILNINSWGVLNISIDGGFNGCANLTCSATDAPTISSTSLSDYFRSCINFNGAIGNWDTSLVTLMNRMFRSAQVFNQDIGSWNVSNVTNVQEMFRSALGFNQDIGAWNVSNVTNFGGFMTNKTAADYDAANLDSIYNNWSLLTLNPNLTVTFGSIKYNASAQAAKDILTSAPNNWSITDGGQV